MRHLVRQYHATISSHRMRGLAIKTEPVSMALCVPLAPRRCQYSLKGPGQLSAWAAVMQTGYQERGNPFELPQLGQLKEQTKIYNLRYVVLVLAAGEL